MIFLYLITLLVVTFVIYSRRVHSYWKRKGIIQMENPHLIFGSYKELFRRQMSPQDFGIKLYKEATRKGYRYWGLYQMFTPVLFVFDLDLIKRVLIKDFEYFMERGGYHNENEPLTVNMATVDGTKWRPLRQRFSPNFTSGKMKMMFQTMAACTNPLVDMLQEYADEERTVEIKDEFSRFTTDVIGNVVFGIECNSMKNPDSEFREYGSRAFKISSRKRFILQKLPNSLLNLFGIRRIDKDVEDFFKNLVKNNMEYREKNNIYRKDFLQVMTDLKNQIAQNPDEPELTLNDITTECFMFFAAGLETSSTVSTFTLYELAVHQDIQEKLRNHIKDVLERHDDKYTYEAFQELTYLDKCIHESMRIHPVATLLPRICTQRYKIPGTDVVLDKGDEIMIPLAGVQYDPKYFPEPEKYDPERFNEESIASRPSITFIPFGEGPRQCIGLRFGFLQSKVGIAAIIKNFKVTLNKKTIHPLEIVADSFIPSAKGGVWLNFERI
ncbi:probable cytochrome P450 6a20 [Cylas formicarius]|uniref:probable cytochrome P450 6a20 n=1 Tax=Cylas formicarius TaxID=197179 RepID=UPI002958D9DF|nr:probable cytochrome P450 6a20 [Cylas formicarius]